MVGVTVMKLECSHKSIGVFAARLEIQRDEAGVDENRRPADESEEKKKKRDSMIRVGTGSSISSLFEP